MRAKANDEIARGSVVRGQDPGRHRDRGHDLDQDRDRVPGRYHEQDRESDRDLDQEVVLR